MEAAALDVGRAPRPQPVEARNEAHITMLYGGHHSGDELLQACAAAVNAETLRVADPQRARIAFVWDGTREMSGSSDKQAELGCGSAGCVGLVWLSTRVVWQWVGVVFGGCCVA